MNKRIRNKYQTAYQELYTRNEKITKHNCQKMIHMFSVKNIKSPVGTIHLDERGNVSEFLNNHQPGGKYHAEDCNQNNPNNPNYRFNKKRPNKRFRYPK